MFWAPGKMQTNTSMILDTTNIWANGPMGVFENWIDQRKDHFQNEHDD
jgi:3-phosphoglycerate kinase